MSEKAIMPRAFEWPTLLALGVTYVSVFALLYFAFFIGNFWISILLIPLIAFHSSLQHEVMHVIEPRWPLLGKVISFPAIGLFLPYIRYRDAHLQHHQNESLTDPLDDPESYYLPKETWQDLNIVYRVVLTFNNTLIGRMLVGPLIGQLAFMWGDVKLVRKGNFSIAIAWLWHLPAVGIVLWVISLSALPIWLYALSCYFAMSILKIRTYLEHRAEEQANGRSVIIEDRGILAFLFLNNNFHAVHHAHPQVPWYNLPALFSRNRKRFLGQNRGYYYGSYWDVFRLYFIKCKEPVEHPHWSLGNRSDR